MLDTLFRRADAMAIEKNVEKIKTIGDCYFAVWMLFLSPNPSRVAPRSGIMVVVFQVSMPPVQYVAKNRAMFFFEPVIRGVSGLSLHLT